METAAAYGSGDLEELRLQISELQIRVKELEKENERLLNVASNCRCVKEEDEACDINAGTSVDVNIKGEQQHTKCDENRSTENQMKQGENEQGNGLCADDSLKVVEDEFSERAGSQGRTIQNCPKRLIALKIMYFGRRYYGFASEAHMEPTIESEIFKALKRTKLLVGSKKESSYSRCGRTDKGVSATGQVIALYLRSNRKDIGGNILEEKSEIDYVRVLNRVLPKDIRVLGWAVVHPDFSARFSCLSREYKYLFWKGNLDIQEMQKGASKFVGEHDFRNFCKMDAANVSNYRRHITDFDISSYNQRSNCDELWAMTIKGSAFLWHQVRCILAVLFLIGQGLETPNIIDALLDITRTPRKPQYNMAPELPLILRCCEFDDVNFVCSADANQALTEHLKNEYHDYLLQAAIHHEAMCCCLSFPDAETRLYEPCKQRKKHIPLMLRQKEPTYEERRAKLDTKLADDI